MSLGLSLDSTLSQGEEIRFKQRNKKLMESLTKTTHFNYEEIQRLAVIYYKLKLISDAKDRGASKAVVGNLLHSALDITEEHIIPHVMTYHDRRVIPYMTLKNWIKMMSTLLRAPLEEKMCYCYDVYKNTSIFDQFITRQTLLSLLKHSLIKDNNVDDDEAVKDMVDMLIKRLDHDRDGKISFDDYRKTVLEYKGYLEAFGDVLPSRLASYAFRQTVIEHFRKK